MQHNPRHGDNMLSEKIKEYLRDKTWSFNEITNITEVIDELADTTYGDLDAKSKVDLLWDVDIEEGLTFGQFFQGLVKKTLKSEIAIIVKAELDSAIIEFKVNKNEVSERSVGGESHKERSTDEKTKDKQ